MVKPGKPLEMWTSTETLVPMAPVRVAEAMHASTPENGRPHWPLAQLSAPTRERRD